jgi:hypothetical protein
LLISVPKSDLEVSQLQIMAAIKGAVGVKSVEIQELRKRSKRPDL